MAGDSWVNPASPTGAGDDLVRGGHHLGLAARRDDDRDDLVGRELGLGRDLLDTGEQRQLLVRSELLRRPHGDRVVALEVGEDDRALAVLEAEPTDEVLGGPALREGALVVE